MFDTPFILKAGTSGFTGVRLASYYSPGESIDVELYTTNNEIILLKNTSFTITQELPYILDEGQKLYIYPVDNYLNVQWGCQGQEVGVNAQSDTDGKSNTEEIVSFYDNENNFGGNSYYDCTSGSKGTCAVWGCHADNDGTVVAKICDDLIDDYLGYDDWYLPSKNQWNEMAVQKNNVINGDFSWTVYVPGVYWTSTEKNEFSAYFEDLMGGSIIDYGYKINNFLFRCVRDPSP
jgi:hypothetical protein